MTIATSSLFRRRAPRVLPGFGLTLGITLFYLSLIVLFPMAALFAKAAELGVGGLIDIALRPRVLAAFRVSMGASFLAALINLVFGTALAWILVRYRFPGRRIIDGLVDLPFALPTAVAGIALTALWSRNGWLGQYAEQLGWRVAFSASGITIVLVFIGLPFVVRTVQPVLEELEAELEEAAATLGADRLQTWWRVILPALSPALLTGFALAFARAVGEYGSVIFIAGNRPGLTEIVPLLIIIQLEQYDYRGAAAVAVWSLLLSFTILLLLNLLQALHRRRYADR
jgi:sulfate transport system permease protein